MKAYILAEIASSHCGDKNMLYELIYAAAKAKADGVKLQVWRKNEIKPPDGTLYVWGCICLRLVYAYLFLMMKGRL